MWQKLCGFLSARSTYNSLSIIKIVTPDGLPQHQRVHEAFQIYQVPSRFEVIQPSAKVYILHFTLNYNSVTHEKCVPRLVRAYMYIKDQYTLLGLGLIYFHCVTGGGNKQYLLKTHFFSRILVAAVSTRHIITTPPSAHPGLEKEPLGSRVAYTGTATLGT